MVPRSSSTRLFLKQAREEFFHVGAIAPSSRFLARVVTRIIPQDREGLHVLEAGAGTGALTAEILQRLTPRSHLDIYEINEDFASHLAARFVHAAPHGNGGTQRRPDLTVNVHNSRIQDLEPGPRYDVIVSGLALNNFAPAVVREII